MRGRWAPSGYRPDTWWGELESTVTHSGGSVEMRGCFLQEGLWSPQGKVTLYQQSHWVQAYRPMGRGGRQEQEVGPDKGFEMVWVEDTLVAQMGK